jgi:replicative DNA helicase
LSCSILAAEFAVAKRSTLPETPESFEPVVPVNLASEKETLGACIEDPATLATALSAGLSVEDFFFSEHRRVFEVITELKREQCPLNYVTVADRLGNKQSDYVLVASLLEGAVVVPSHVLHLMKILRKKARLRSLLEIAEWIQESLKDYHADPDAMSKTIRTRLGAK